MKKNTLLLSVFLFFLVCKTKANEVSEKETVLPTVQSFYPANEFTSFLVNESLIITFDAPVNAYGPEKLYIRRVSDNAVHEVIQGYDLNVYNTTRVVINPSIDFDPDTEYYVYIEPSFFRDNSTNTLPAISGWKFLPIQVSPFGISAGLKLWLRADKGLNINSNNEVISWEDQSGNNNNATPVNTLTKVDNVFNFNPAVYFENGDNAYFNVDLSDIKNSNYNIITVLQRDNSNASSYILGTNATVANQGLHFGYRLNNTAALAHYANDVNLGVNAFDNPKISPAILRGQLNQSSGRVIAELRNGMYNSQTDTNTTTLTGNANGVLGRGFDSNGFEGYLAEVIVYSNALTDLQVDKIYSYLATKYGFMLKSSFSSAFTGIIEPYWSPFVDTDYNNNVVIIGADKRSNLQQKKSKSNQEGTILTIEKPDGIKGDLQGIAVGNNNQPITVTSTNAPPGYNITNRKWLVMVTEDLTGISMSFEFPNNTGILSDYRLYLSGSDTNFFGTGSFYSPTSISGDTITFSNLVTDSSFSSSGTFYIALAEKTNPRLVSVSPLNNSENVIISDNLEIAFNENIVKGSGNITIYDASNNTVFESISVTSSNVTISGAVATINPTKNLEFSKNYYVQVSSGAFRDNGGFGFGGISNSTTWTFSTELGGPAGITSGLQLWLKANEGITTSGNNITQWKDQSSNKRTATPVNSPIEATNPINLNNAVHFDGTGAGFQITDGILGTNTYSDVWVYTVQNVERLTTGYMFREDMADGNRLTAHLPWSNGYAYYDFGLWDGLGRVQTNTSAININETDLWTLASSTSTSTPSGFRKSISKNGLTIASNNTDNTTESRTGNNSDFFVGIQTASGGGAYHGDMSEMIVYTTKPTAFQQQKIQSYLAIKYGITLDRTDASAAIAEGHYLNSDGTIIWNTYNNASYHNNIAIIAKDAGSVLQQNESKSVNSGVVLSLGKSGGITNDKDAIAVGSNNQPFTMSPTNAPAGYNISSRVWKMQKTGTLDDIFFSFDIPDNTGDISDYQVIMSSSPTNFTSGTGIFPATSIQGNKVNVNRISTVDGNYYVLAQKIVPPIITSLSPEDDSINVTLQNSIEITFSENVLKNTGNITIQNATDNSILETIEVTSSKVTIANNVVTISPTFTFSFDETYYVLIDGGAFTDITTNLFAGITNTNTWNFNFTQNTAPIFTTSPVVTVNENVVYDYVIKTDDVDNNNVSVTATTIPSWLTLETKTTVSTFAGNGNFAFVNGPALSSSFKDPEAIILDDSDNFFVADYTNNSIRIIESNGLVSTFSGRSASGSSDGANPSYFRPVDIDFNSTGDLIIVDRFNYRIRKVTPSKVASTIAGSTRGYNDGTGSSAQFNAPSGVVVDANDNMYVTDTDNHKIRKITPAGAVTTFAGSDAGFLDGTGTDAKFNRPIGIVIDSKGNLFVADGNNYRIRKIDITGKVTTFAGSERGFNDGVGTNAKFNSPTGLEIDKRDNIYVADRLGYKIRKITPDAVVTTIAGTTRGYLDGTKDVAQFSFIRDVVIDSNDNLYVTEANRVRKIVTETKLTGTPTLSDIGTHNVVLEVNDGKGGVTQQSFTITVSDITPPTVTTFTPLNNVTGPSFINNDLSITFSENVAAGLGNIYLHKKSDDSIVETINVASANVQFTNNLVSINPTQDLSFEEDYYIKIDGTAFKDLSNNNYAGISTTTDWAFKVSRETNNYTASRGQWSTVSSWSLGRTPIATDNVVILTGTAGSVNIPNVEMHNLNVLGNVTIRVASSLTVNGDFSNSGQFVIVSDATDSGVIIVKGVSTGNVFYARGGLLEDKWSLISPPVKNQKIVEFAQDVRNDIRVNTVPDPDRYAIATYNDANIAANSKWEYFNINTDTNSVFDIGLGYSISRGSDGNLIFEGVLELGDINRSIVSNQWNVIGNPFTTYYPMNKNGSSSFLDDNSGKLEIPAVYIWDNAQVKYVSITNLISSTERFFTPAQGFFVKPNEAATLLFSSNKRSLKPASGVHIFNRTANTTPYLKLYVEKEAVKVNTDIIYSTTATKGFDVAEDIGNFAGASFDITSHLAENSEGKNYTIQSLPVSEIEDLVVPLNLKGQENDEVIFSIEAFNFPANINIYLEDKITNQFIKLDDANAEYRITLNEDTNGVGRFYLKTTAQTLFSDSTILSGVELYKYNNTTIRFTGLLNQKGTFKLFDILGKQILKTNFEGKVSNDIHLPNLEAAVYIVEIQTEKGKVSKKIIIE